MKETVFKVGDKVYCILYGWGIVYKIDDDDSYPVDVNFKLEGDMDTISYTCDGRLYSNTSPTLSFTEYTLDDFSQERPIELPEVGEEIMVSDNGTIWKLATFINYHPTKAFPVEAEMEGDIYNYTFFKRLR